jgi:hypothetical protein
MIRVGSYEKRFFLFLNLLRAVLTGFKSALFFDGGRIFICCVT